MKAYKAFNHDMTCRDFQFEIGKTYTHEGEISLCNAGFHACEAPLDVLSYYPPTALFAEVELGGVSGEKSSDTKRVGKSITVKAGLNIAGLVSAQIEWVSKQVAPEKKDAAVAGHSGTSAVAGHSGTSAVAGAYGTSAVAGAYGTSAVAGESGTSAVAGAYGKSAVAGAYGKSAVAGAYGKSVVAGAYGKSVVAGAYGMSVVAGDGGESEASGKQTIAMVAGLNGKARAGINGAFALAYNDGEQIRIAVGIIGEDGILADTWYEVKDGQLKEVSQ